MLVLVSHGSYCWLAGREILVSNGDYWGTASNNIPTYEAVWVLSGCTKTRTSTYGLWSASSWDRLDWQPKKLAVDHLELMW